MSDAPAPIGTIEAAAELLERYAVIMGKAAAIDARRNSLLVRANAAADAKLQPLLDEAEAIRALIDPWWRANAAALTKGKRKSIELGGCIVGTKTGAASLAIKEGGWDAAAIALKAMRWAKELWRAKPAVEKAAVLKALEGPRAAELKKLGFVVVPGAEELVLKIAAPGGTPAKR